MNKTRNVALLAILCVVASLSVPALAGDPEGNRQFRFGALFSVPTDDLSLTGSTTELADAAGIHAGFEYRITTLVGVEPTVTWQQHDVEVTTPSSGKETFGEVDLLTVAANVNVHILPSSEIDFYVGATLGYAFWSDITRAVFQNIETGEELVYGLNLGVDVPIGSNGWGFAGAVNYLAVDLPVDGGTDIGVSPVQVKAGASYRF